MENKKDNHMIALDLQGICNSPEREALIESAIKVLQTHPETFAEEKYFGIKNYASFGDQREDHPYGSGPRHGTIVFSIGRNRDNYKPEHAAKYIEVLIAFRDDKGFVPECDNAKKLNIQGTYNLYVKSLETIASIEKYYKETL